MTSIDPADLKPGDRVRIIREGAVRRLDGGRIVLESTNEDEPNPMRRTAITWINPIKPGTTVELLERPLPPEPGLGTVVVFRRKSGDALSNSAYQRFARARGKGEPCWQSTRRGGGNDSTYTWADILAAHPECEYERIEIGAQP